MSKLIHLDGNSLTLEDVIAVARHGATCEIVQEAKEAVEGAPTTLKEGLSKEDAEKLAKAFTDAGAEIEIK